MIPLSIKDLVSTYSRLAAGVRKVRRARRYNRTRTAKALRDRISAYWRQQNQLIFNALDEEDGWDTIAQHTNIGKVAKAMTDNDRKLLDDIIAKYGIFNDVSETATNIVNKEYVDTFEDAAKFGTKQLGVANPQFELKNERIRDFLLNRRSAVVNSTRNHVDQVYSTIIENFYDLGANPYDKAFITALKKDLAYKTDWEAKRFALTETGIVAEQAQVETYRKNSVGRKQWNATGNNTRDSHLKLHGVIIDIDQKFNVGGSPADHPLDESLPAAELVNCHCWLSPVVDEDFDIDPRNVWRGE